MNTQKIKGIVKAVAPGAFQLETDEVGEVVQRPWQSPRGVPLWYTPSQEHKIVLPTAGQAVTVQVIPQTTTVVGLEVASLKRTKRAK